MDISDTLRTVSNIMDPDPCTLRDFASASEAIPFSGLAQRRAVIEKFNLLPSVPESIQIHYETAKNLYLYAWFVRRFHMVSEHYVFSTLELALRERLSCYFTPEQKKREPSLRVLLQMAAAKKFISNKRLPRQAWAINLARERIRQEEMDRVLADDIEESHIHEIKISPTDSELDFDWIGHLTIQIPHMRNMHAHGSDLLYPHVLWTFEVIRELVNQLFAPASELSTS